LAVRIPTRFEHLRGDPTPLIVGVEADLASFEKLRRASEVQQGGVLGFMAAASGTGKTTAVYSLASILSDRYCPVFVVPSTVTIRDLPTWLNAHLPAQSDRTIPILIDNREASDDDVGLGQLMSSLNGLFRKRPDVMALWPTTDESWRTSLIAAARQVGGNSLVPASGELRIAGPDKSEWPAVLERVLIQLDQAREDLAIDDAAIADAVDQSDHIGGFLERIRDLVADRVDDVQLNNSLPKLLFVISSDSAVVGEANRLRRAGTLRVRAEELLSYSRRSGSGLYWQARLSNPQHHLAYIASLFEARIATMTPSSVSYAALHYGDADLQERVKSAGLGRSPANAATTLKNTDFYRLLTGTTSYELTSTTKGKTSATTLAAYAAVQAASSKRHKAINQSICALAESVVPEFQASAGKFEVDLGDARAFADAVIPLHMTDLHLEFHHLSAAHCKASSMAAYIMEKLQVYALQYNLIPR
jgi:hypothetical protein